MFAREKIVLSLLNRIAKPISKTAFVKLVFLLRNETMLKDMSSFYDFVPYKYGPFSFTLYRDLSRFQQNGCVVIQGNEGTNIRLTRSRLETGAGKIPGDVGAAVRKIVAKYGHLDQQALVKDVYSRYPWFAIKSELPERTLASIVTPKNALPAVYTSGYEGQSVDAFFNRLLKLGISVVIDVRANPISRKYGFAGVRLRQFCKRLGLLYRHEPSLGIPSIARSKLSDFASYQRLLSRYEQLILSRHDYKVEEVGRLMSQKPSVLVCFEKNVHCCHRGRLADAVAHKSALKVVHL